MPRDDQDDIDYDSPDPFEYCSVVREGIQGHAEWRVVRGENSRARKQPFRLELKLPGDDYYHPLHEHPALRDDARDDSQSDSRGRWEDVAELTVEKFDDRRDGDTDNGNDTSEQD